jgi:hypothetical protein
MNVRGRVRLPLRLGRLSHLRDPARFFYGPDTAPTRTTHGILKGSKTNFTLHSAAYRNFSNSAFKMSDPQKWTAPVVRKTFLDFFEKNGHTVGM